MQDRNAGAAGVIKLSTKGIVPVLKFRKPACVNVMIDSTVFSPATPLFYQTLKME